MGASVPRVAPAKRGTDPGLSYAAPVGAFDSDDRPVSRKRLNWGYDNMSRNQSPAGGGTHDLAQEGVAFRL